MDFDFNLSDILEAILKYSVIGIDKFWELIIWVAGIALNLSYLIVAFVALWSLVYITIRKFNVDWANKQKEITIKLLKENFYGSEMYEAGENLVESIYGAVVSIINTLALIITLAFTGFALIIAYPFRFLQNLSDEVNFKLMDMREEQKLKIVQRKAFREEKRNERKSYSKEKN